MKVYQMRDTGVKRISEKVGIEQLYEKASRGLLQLSISLGLDVVREMMEAEVATYAGPKGKHSMPERTGYRHGTEQTTVVLGGQKVHTERPRVRAVDGTGELPFEVLKLFQDEDPLNEAILAWILNGVSTRKYARTLDVPGARPVWLRGKRGNSVKNRPIRKTLLIYVPSILIPILIFINISYSLVVSTLRDQISLSNIDIASLYVDQVDSYLSDNNLLLVTKRSDTSQLMKLSSPDDDQRLLANVSLFNDFRKTINLYPAIDNIFAYTTKYNCVVSASGEKISYSEKKSLWRYIESLPSNGENVDVNWTLVTINGNKYFLNVKAFDGGYLGIVTKPGTLKSLLPYDKLKITNLIFADNSGNPLTDINLTQEHQLDLSKDLSSYYLTGNAEKQLIVGAESAMANFRLLLVKPDKEIRHNISWVYSLSYVIIIASFLSFAGVIFCLCRKVMNPMERIRDAIIKMGQGDFSFDTSSKGIAREYVDIYNSYMQMLKQIETLKIRNYEERIKRQQAELQFYQMQIKPHFILNCLTTIANLSRTGENEKLYAFISDFSHFSRYMFHKEFVLVSLKDELSQIEHFINMQKIRLPDKVFLMTEIPDDFNDRRIPAMILQTLVENSIKHGLDPSYDICIFIQCSEINSLLNNENILTLVVEDTGKGFPSEVLAEINSPYLEMNHVKGFGLRNVKATLDLNYNGKASIFFENMEPTGAHIEIKLPGKDTYKD
ncbi:MAG: histidine kinase [Oscillospiraceae bacterium]|jgi:two-component system sensor histidine kinase YesM|nr:histidine kinase [Oscillospiraceae bacterium]